MSDALINPQRTAGTPRQKNPVVASIRILAWLLSSPFRLMIAIRSSMTGASVVLLLGSILSLNIIWGYPWLGVFAAFTAMLALGLIMNWTLRPNFRVDHSVPAMIPAGETLAVQSHLRNERRFPAMELLCGVDPQHLPPSRRQRRRGEILFQCKTNPAAHDLVSSGETIDVPAEMVFHRRGIQTLPDMLITTHFPFQLFKSTVRIPVATTIAVTPKLLVANEDNLVRDQLTALGSWMRKLASGDAMDYTGSREYVVGMPVRRWDFRSWARLGKPIVREFQSPSIRTLTLLVDTAADPLLKGDAEDELLERTLSLAATALTDLSRQRIHVRMFVTGESVDGLADQKLDPTHVTNSDYEPLLIRLAQASAVERKLASESLEEAIEIVGNSPCLLLLGRSKGSDPDESFDLPSNVTVLRVDLSHHLPPNPMAVKAGTSTLSAGEGS